MAKKDTTKKVTPVKAVTPRVSTFDKIIMSLTKGPKSRKQLAQILFNNSRKEGYTIDNAMSQVPIRMNHLRKRGFVITSREKKYHLDGKTTA